MIRNRSTFVSFALITLGIFLLFFISASANAQAPSVTSKPLLKTTLSDDTEKEVIMASVEFPTGSVLNRHTHPGDEFVFVLQGTLEISAEGRETRRVSTGDVFHNPRGLVHEVRNVGDTPVRLANIFIVDKGKPFFQPIAK
jgi:quercetin dioxygenase-like cupin family protein